jgi:hypothetical protein
MHKQTRATTTVCLRRRWSLFRLFFLYYCFFFYIEYTDADADNALSPPQVEPELDFCFIEYISMYIVL